MKRSEWKKRGDTEREIEVFILKRFLVYEMTASWSWARLKPGYQK